MLSNKNINKSKNCYQGIMCCDLYCLKLHPWSWFLSNDDDDDDDDK